MAFKSLQEMLFSDFVHVSRDLDVADKSAESFCWPSLSQTAQSEVTDRSTILIETVSSKDRSTADLFTELLKKSINEEESSSSKSKSGLSVKLVCRLVIDCIVDMIISSSSDNDQVRQMQRNVLRGINF